MADITQTAANVRRGSGYSEVSGQAGEALTCGNLVALDDTDGYYYKADADHATVARRKISGIVLNDAAAATQAITVMTAGYVNPGGTVAVGEIYVMSGNAGGIAPKADLAAADTVSIFGVGYSTTLIQISIFNSETIMA